MTLREQMAKSVPAPVVRGLAVLGFLGLFFLAASLFRPGDSAAEVQTLRIPEQPVADARLRAMEGPAYLGSLVGATHTIDVYGTARGPRYTVKDLQGVVLTENLSSEELYAQYPELDVGAMRADVDTGPQGHEPASFDDPGSR